MKIQILAGVAAAGIAFVPLAYADDYDGTTIVDQDGNTVVDQTDTTGSIIVKKRQPTVVIERQQPTVIIKKQQPDVIIHQDDEDDYN